MILSEESDRSFNSFTEWCEKARALKIMSQITSKIPILPTMILASISLKTPKVPFKLSKSCQHAWNKLFSVAATFTEVSITSINWMQFSAKRRDSTIASSTFKNSSVMIVWSRYTDWWFDSWLMSKIKRANLLQPIVQFNLSIWNISWYMTVFSSWRLRGKRWLMKWSCFSVILSLSQDMCPLKVEDCLTTMIWWLKKQIIDKRCRR